MDGVCREVFGLHNYKVINVKSIGCPTPLSTQEIEQSLTKRIHHLQAFSISSELDFNKQKDDIYFCTIQKGFLPINKGWLFCSFAVFKKKADVWYTGASEACAIKKELWPFIEMPDEKRCEKFKEFDPMLEFQPLIYYLNRTSETDWYKQAFRNCIPIAARS